MTPIDTVAIVAWLAITASFYFVRRRLIRYVAACVVVTAPPTWAAIGPAPALDRAPWLLLLLGVLLYGSGLLGVRLMLRRSVSLHLLSSLVAGQGLEGLRGEMGNRLSDLERFRLANRRAGSFALTRFGRVVAAGVSATHALFGLKG